MEGLEEVIADLLSGTAIENDEAELDRFRRLAPKEQLEVGIVLRTAALLERKLADGSRAELLAGVRRVADAQRFLSQDAQCSTDLSRY